MLRIFFLKKSNVFNGIATHFLIDSTGLGFYPVVFQHFSHGQAVLNWGQRDFAGKRVLVIR